MPTRGRPGATTLPARARTLDGPAPTTTATASSTAAMLILRLLEAPVRTRSALRSSLSPRGSPRHPVGDSIRPQQPGTGQCEPNHQ